MSKKDKDPRTENGTSPPVTSAKATIAGETNVGRPTIPAGIQEAVDAWIACDSAGGKQIWERTNLAVGVREAVAKDEKIAVEEKRKPIKLGDAVTASKGLRRTAYYDDLKAADVAKAAHVEPQSIPDSYWHFVRLGRAVSQETKRAERSEATPTERKRRIEKVVSETAKAAKAFVDDPHVGKEIIQQTLGKYRPEPTAKPGTIELDVKERGAIDRDAFLNDMRERWDGPDYRGSDVNVIVVAMPERTSATIQAALDTPKLRGALAAIADKRGDVIVVFEQPKPNSEPAGKEDK